MNNNLDVTVIISAASTEDVLFEEAINSVLSQSFRNLELVVVDDGLSDENRAFLAGVKDPRLIVLTNEKNIGQSKSVNKALKVARGTYIIRMDADDVMLPTRIADEVAYMEEHADVIVAGALAIRSNDRRIIPRVYPDSDCFAIGLLFSNDMVHPTMVIRREMALERSLWYDEDFLYAQDYKFWADALACGKVGFLEKPVLVYRIHPGQILNTKSGQRPKFSKRARQRAFAHFGVDLTDDETDELFAFITGRDFHGFDICPVLRRKCRAAMDDNVYSLFARELSFRELKAGLKVISRKRVGVALGSGEFWRAAFRFWYWPFYCRSLRSPRAKGDFGADTTCCDRSY